ncbi:Ig-like domain-containing protein [Shewanella aquimarina]|uniref:Ig-like domain-containing protein n=1 Tax=Shewanella aquimarina TaxID=260365 RepID=UPI0020149BA0|nr:Ig-like domain-containing protein [Shewanella aquimarina]MCL2910264.1 Ig-like domain-containing protein [Shewanella aquimarina]
MSSVHCAVARTNSTSTFLKTLGFGLMGAGLLSASAIMPVHADTHSSISVAQSEVGEHQLKGVLSVAYTDYQDGELPELHHKLTLDDGSVVPFNLVGKNLELRNGQEVTLPNSVLKNPNLYPEQITLFDGGVSSATSTTSSLDAITVTGDRSVLVMLVKFENSSSEYASVEQANDLVFNQGNAFYLENSNGNVSLSGDTIGYLTLPLDKFVCDTTAIGNEADIIARDQGFEPNDYDHVMYVIEANLGCRWSGQGTVAGYPGRTWIKNFQIKTVVHELGHNLGLHHSHSKDCGESVSEGTCSTTEYGDIYDAMGGADEGAHFNAFQKERLGWLNNQVTTVTSDQVITLDYYESLESNSTLAAKVYLGNDANGNARYYYLEYRTPTGFDAFLFDKYANLADSIILREGTENTPGSSYLLDSTPMSTSSDWTDSTIGVGQTFYDADNGVTIELLAVDGYQATVGISHSSATTCIAKAPSLTAMSSGSMQTWEQKSLSYSLTNNDSADCPSTNVSLAATLPTGWTGQWEQSAMTLAPQQTVTVNYTLTVNGDVGAQQLALVATPSNGKTNAELLQTITVEATSVNTAPVALADTLTLSSKTSGIISVLGNDSDAEGDQLTVVTVSAPAKGSVVINSDNTITYIPAKSFKSSDSFTYTISDGELQATATVKVSLTTSSGDGGGKPGGKGKNK